MLAFVYFFKLLVRVFLKERFIRVRIRAVDRYRVEQCPLETIQDLLLRKKVRKLCAQDSICVSVYM